MNPFSTMNNSLSNPSEKFLKLKGLLETSKFFQKRQSGLAKSDKSLNFSPILSKNLPLYFSLVEKPVNLLFSLDQFFFEFSKKIYQQRKAGDFFQQLKERKKLSLFYGSLSQKQLQNLFADAAQKKGYFSKNLLSLLERRLDVVIFRSGLVKSIAEARQLIHHEKILVNSLKMSIPSYCLNPGDVVSITPNAVKKITHQLVNTAKKKRQFLRIYGDLSSKLKKPFFLLKKKRKIHESKIAYNLFVSLISTRIQLRTFWKFNAQKYTFKNENSILALLKLKSNSLKGFKNDTSLGLSKNINTRKTKQKKSQKLFHTTESSFQKNPVFWSTRLTNLKSRKKSFPIQRKWNPSRFQKTSGVFSKNTETLCKKNLVLFCRYLQSSKKVSGLVRSNMRKCLIKRSNYQQKSAFKKVLDFRLVKPLNVEISYTLFTVIYLYSPQRIHFPFYIDLDLIKRSFR